MTDLKNKLVFIVDDDPLWSTYLTMVLTGMDCTHIHCYSNAADCLGNISKNPSLIFLDYEIEGGDGLQLLQQIKQVQPDAVVIFCSAHERISLAVKAMKNGSFHFVAKSSCTVDELSAVVNEIKTRQLLEEKIF